MNPLEPSSKSPKQSARLAPALILTLATVAALMLFARTPASAPAEPWETVLHEPYAPAADIVPSPVEGFGRARLATDDGGQ